MRNFGHLLSIVSMAILTFCFSALTGQLKAEPIRVALIKAIEGKYEKWPCAAFKPKEEITDPKKVNALVDALGEIDEKGIPKDEEVQLELILRAFPNLDRDNFAHGRISWDLRKVNFDGKPPSDYALLLDHHVSSGEKTWLLAIRSERYVLYQEIIGFDRGFFNAMHPGWPQFGRFLKESQSQFGRFLKESGISDNPSDLDGDGVAELIVRDQFEDCPPDSAESDSPVYPCSMADLVFFPALYFWNGNRMVCSGGKVDSYYRRLVPLLELLDPRIAKAIRKELGKMRIY